MDGSCQDRDENACGSERTHLSVHRMQQKKVTEDSELSFLFLFYTTEALFFLVLEFISP